MRTQSSATLPKLDPLPRDAGRQGLAWGGLGVLAFSWTVPLTRVAVTGGLSPSFVGLGRAVVPGLLAIALLAVTRQRWPGRGEWRSVLAVAAGCAIGFALLTGIAERSVPASHAAVIVGLLPLATATLSVARTGERPPLGFWLASAAGAAAVIVLAGLDQGGLGHLGAGDLLLFGAVLAAAVGYAEGGLVARSLGAWQTICWALAIALPVTLPVTLALLPGVIRAGHVPLTALLAFGYLSLVSQFTGFFAWYRGLAIGPLSRVSQTQLIQPLLSIAWSAAFLGEHPGPALYAGIIIVPALALLAIRARAR